VLHQTGRQISHVSTLHAGSDVGFLYEIKVLLGQNIGIIKLFP
jgi:hypothetical protein